MTKQYVYLLHFSSPLKHAQHYIGWTEHIKERIQHHRNGTGAKICRAATEEGINLIVSRVWKDKDGNFERKLHKYKNSKYLCPICSGKDALRRMRK